MRFIFKTSYDQDIRMAQHGGHVFWYGLLMLLLINFHLLTVLLFITCNLMLLCILNFS